MNTTSATPSLLLLIVAITLLSLLYSASATSCFGIDSSSTAVCSGGRGQCVALDTCNCYAGFSGSSCNQTACGWTSIDSLGAPQPVISATIDSSNNVIIEVKVTKRKNVKHLVGLQGSTACLQEAGILEQETLFPDLYFPQVAEDGCNVYYAYNQTLQYFINHYDDKIMEKLFSNDADTFTATSIITVNYFNYGVQNNTCQQTTFTAPFKVQVYLQGVATIAVENTQEAVGVIQQELIRVSTEGILQLKLSIKLNTRGSLGNLTFVSSAPDTTIALKAQTLSSSTYQNGANTYKTYSIYITSTAVHADYGAEYAFETSLTRYQNNDEAAGVIEQSIKVKFLFTLQYSLPVPAGSAILGNVTVSTEIALYDKNYATKKNSFSNLEPMWVLSSIREKVTIPNRRLAVNNAYICCVKNREAMPVYNPSNNQPGCTVNNPSVMSFWSALVLNQVAVTGNSFNTQIQVLPFIDDKAGFSIDLLPLYLDPALNTYQRLCYLHVESITVAKTRSNLFEQADSNNNILAFTPLQLLPKQTTSNNNDQPKVTSAATTSTTASMFILFAAAFVAMYIML